jgi:hypothetical protein
MIARLLLLAAPTQAGSRWLINDDFAEGADAGVQGGFAMDECWGSVYVPDSGEYPFELTAVRMLVGGNSSQEIFSVNFYSQSGTDMNGADLIAGEGAAITGADDAFNELTIADLELDLPLIESGNVGVGVCLDAHDGYPAIARDAGGMDHSDRNYIYADIGTGSKWHKSSTLGLTGDWIMRLCITGDNVADEGCDDIDPGGGESDADADADADSDSDADGDTDADGAFTMTQVTPTSVIEGQAIDIVILGTGFASGAEARIGGIPIVGQSRLNEETLSGRTPTTLPVGVHDVEVVLDDGSSALLPGAFEVLPAESAEKEGCGCASGGVEGASGLLLGLFALLTRRRSRA